MELVLRQERRKRGWTQEFVANSVGVTKATLQRLETAQRNPSYPVLVKLEDLFRLSHRQLFALADDAPQSQGQNSTQNTQNQQY